MECSLDYNKVKSSIEKSLEDKLISLGFTVDGGDFYYESSKDLEKLKQIEKDYKSGIFNYKVDRVSIDVKDDTVWRYILTQPGSWSSLESYVQSLIKSEDNIDVKEEDLWLTNPIMEQVTAQKLFNFMRKLNIKTSYNKNLSDNAAAIIRDNIILLRNQKSLYELPEEIAHFYVGLLDDNNPILLNLMNNVTSFPIYGKTYDLLKKNKLYTKNGKPDINKIKKEAVGKLIAEFINKKDKQEEYNKRAGWLAINIRAFIKFLRRILSGTMYRKEQLYANVADKILGADLSDLNPNRANNYNVYDSIFLSAVVDSAPESYEVNNEIYDNLYKTMSQIQLTLKKNILKYVDEEEFLGLKERLLDPENKDIQRTKKITESFITSKRILNDILGKEYATLNELELGIRSIVDSYNELHILPDVIMKVIEDYKNGIFNDKIKDYSTLIHELYKLYNLTRVLDELSSEYNKMLSDVSQNSNDEIKESIKKIQKDLKNSNVFQLIKLDVLDILRKETVKHVQELSKTQIESYAKFFNEKIESHQYFANIEFYARKIVENVSSSLHIAFALGEKTDTNELPKLLGSKFLLDDKGKPVKYDYSNVLDASNMDLVTSFVSSLTLTDDPIVGSIAAAYVQDSIESYAQAYQDSSRLGKKAFNIIQKLMDKGMDYYDIYKKIQSIQNRYSTEDDAGEEVLTFLEETLSVTFTKDVSNKEAELKLIQNEITRFNSLMRESKIDPKIKNRISSLRDRETYNYPVDIEEKIKKEFPDVNDDDLKEYISYGKQSAEKIKEKKKKDTELKDFLVKYRYNEYTPEFYNKRKNINSLPVSFIRLLKKRDEISLYLDMASAIEEEVPALSAYQAEYEEVSREIEVQKSRLSKTELNTYKEWEELYQLDEEETRIANTNHKVQIVNNLYKKYRALPAYKDMSDSEFKEYIEHLYDRKFTRIIPNEKYFQEMEENMKSDGIDRDFISLTVQGKEALEYFDSIKKELLEMKKLFFSDKVNANPALAVVPYKDSRPMLEYYNELETAYDIARMFLKRKIQFFYNPELLKILTGVVNLRNKDEDEVTPDDIRALFNKPSLTDDDANLIIIKASNLSSDGSKSFRRANFAELLDNILPILGVNKLSVSLLAEQQRVETALKFQQVEIDETTNVFMNKIPNESYHFSVLQNIHKILRNYINDEKNYNESGIYLYDPQMLMNIIEENAYTTIESLSETILNKEVFENILLISSTLATVNEDYRSLYDILRMTHTLKNDVYVPLDLFTLSDYTLTPELFDEVPLLRRYKVRDGSDTKEYEREDGTKYINTTNYVREKIYRNDPRVLRGEVKPNVDMNGNWLPLPLEVIDGKENPYYNKQYKELREANDEVSKLLVELSDLLTSSYFDYQEKFVKDSKHDIVVPAKNLDNYEHLQLRITNFSDLSNELTARGSAIFRNKNVSNAEYENEIQKMGLLSERNIDMKTGLQLNTGDAKMSTRKRIPIKRQSKDLLASMLFFIDDIYEYKNKTKHISIVDGLLATLKAAKEKNNSNKNRIQIFENFAETTLKGNIPENWSNLPIIREAVSFITNLAARKLFLDPLGALINLVGGHMQLLVEAGFKAEEIQKIEAAAAKSIPWSASYIGDQFKKFDIGLQSRLVKIFNMIPDPMELYERTSIRSVTTDFGAFGMAPRTATEISMGIQLSLVIINRYLPGIPGVNKIEDLYEIDEVSNEVVLKPEYKDLDEEWNPVTGTIAKKIKSEIQQSYTFIQGNYYKNTPAYLAYSSLGQIALLFKKWYYSSMLRRYGRITSDPVTGAIRVPNYSPILDVMTQLFYAMNPNSNVSIASIRERIGNWSKEEKDAVQKMLADIIYISIFGAMILLLGFDEDDENKKQTLSEMSKFKKYLIFTLMRVQGELGTFIPLPILSLGLNETIRTVADPLSSIKTTFNSLSNIINLSFLGTGSLLGFDNDKQILFQKEGNIWLPILGNIKEKGDYKIVPEILKFYLGVNGKNFNPDEFIMTYIQLKNAPAR
jgi:hypothetical protein